MNDFKKPPVPQVFYMPLWTKADKEAIAPLFPDATNWTERYEILGGIPRHILEVPTGDPAEIKEMICVENNYTDY